MAIVVRARLQEKRRRTDAKEAAAATLIQAAIRGRQTRKRVYETTGFQPTTGKGKQAKREMAERMQRLLQLGLGGFTQPKESEAQRRWRLVFGRNKEETRQASPTHAFCSPPPPPAAAA